MVFGQKLKILTLQNIMPGNSTSQEEQNGANFSFVAPSSEELWVWKEIRVRQDSQKKEMGLGLDCPQDDRDVFTYVSS